LTPSTNVVTASFAAAERIALRAPAAGWAAAAGAEDARRLDHDVDLEIAPGQGHGVKLAETRQDHNSLWQYLSGRS
jgi:hypothetical protein